MTKAPLLVKITGGGAFSMERYNIYEQARDSAWKFLIENRIKSLPVKFSPICRQNNITLLYDNNKTYLSESKRGATFTDETGKFNIILNPCDNIKVQRYTIAHEFGHIFLGHLVSTDHDSSEIQLMSKMDIEYQAERFAIDILAPACVLWKLDLHTAKEISELCNISMKSAYIRAERMKILYKRNKFLTSPLERQVCEQFSDFIYQYKSR